MNISNIDNKIATSIEISNEPEVKSLNNISRSEYMAENPFHLIMYSQWMQDIFISNGDEDDGSSEW